jgi:hypothetical protein
MPRKSIGEIVMTNAERQAHYRAARAAAVPAIHIGRPTIAAGPGVGPTTSPASSTPRLSSWPGWKVCRTAYRTARPPRRCARSAIWTSANSRRSSRHAGSDGIEPRAGIDAAALVLA